MKLLPAFVLAAACLVLGFYLGRATIGQADGGSAGFATARNLMAQSPPASEARSAVAANGTPTPYTVEEVKSLAYSITAGSLRGADLAAVWGELEQRLAVSDMSALRASLGEDQDENLGPAVRALFTEWAKQNPQAAWRAALALSPPDKCNDGLHAIIDFLAIDDPQNALSLAESIQNVDLRNHMRTSALQAFAAKDPAQAFEIAIGTQNGDGSELAAIISEWAKRDHHSAYAAIANLTGPAGEKARSALVISLAEKDPRTAWEYAVRLPPYAGSDWYFNDPQQHVIEQWAKSDPSAALAAALTIRNEERRDYAISNAMHAWASSDLRAALAHSISTKDPILRADLLQTLAGSSAAVGQELLSALLEHGPSGEGFSDTLSTLLQSWARKNPQEAAAVAKQLPPGPALSAATPRVVEEWLNSSPDKGQILAWASSLPEGNARDQALRSVFQHWSTQDPDSALRAIGTAGASSNDEAVQGLVQGWSSHDAGAAARWAITLPDESLRDSSLRTALIAWSRTAPAQAAAFVQVMDEANRTRNTGHLIETWASRDAGGAAAWLKAQPVGTARDAGITALARQIAREDPQSALAWTQTISDSAEQEQETERVLRDWLYYDPAGAQAWARQNSLPENVRRSLSGKL